MKANPQYLQALSSWYANFFEKIPDECWYDKDRCILDGATIAVMTEKLIEEHLFRNTTAISLKIAQDKGILFPATYIDELVDRVKTVRERRAK